ncbi:MAG: exosortase A [Candidatus Accumulibacter sp.]|jgi:exosortase A|nr:exosortase A [Accumulibacter sp.]
MNAARPIAGRWPPVLAALAALLLIELAIYRETALSMAAIWARSGTFMHGFVVPPISLWLIWRERRALAQIAPAPEARFALLAAFCGFVWRAGQLATVAPVAQFALVGLLIASAAALVGGRAARAVGFPLAFLFFAVPFGEFFVPQLMDWTADFIVAGLRVSGVPVYREARSIMIPSGSWSVIEACSGVRYLIASAMLGTLFAYLTYRTLWRRLAFIAFSLVVPVVANWLRAYLIVMIGHLSSNRLAVGIDHLIYGWLFFGLVIVVMFAVGSRWREDFDPPAGTLAADAPTPGGNFPVRLAAAFLACVLCAAVWPFLQWRDAQTARPSAVRLEAPAAPGGWTVGGSLPEWRPGYETASASLERRYTKDDRTVGLFIAYYRDQNERRKLVSTANAPEGAGRGWKAMGEGRAAAPVLGSPLDVRTAELVSPAGEKLLAWRWYWIAGRRTSSDYMAKAWTALSALSGRGDDSAAVVLYTADETPGEAEALLRDFAEAAAPGVEKVLTEAMQGHD